VFHGPFVARIHGTEARNGPPADPRRGAIEELRDRGVSQVTISLEFEGHGIGRLLVPLVVRPQARKQLPTNLQKLKEVLERSA
jgi:hypothetical protein